MPVSGVSTDTAVEYSALTCQTYTNTVTLVYVVNICTQNCVKFVFALQNNHPSFIIHHSMQRNIVQITEHL